MVVRVIPIYAMLALAACGESQSPYSICTLEPEASTFYLRAQRDDDPKKTTEADITRAEAKMTYDRADYAHCWERVANEVISMGGTDDAAKAQAADNCKGALSGYRGASYRYHRVYRELHGIGGDDWEEAEADVAEFSKSLDLRLEAFKLCHANRTKRKN